MKHLFYTQRDVYRHFPDDDLELLEEAVTESENHHSGEIRLVIESSLALADICKGISPRQRAVETFSEEHVWDTEHNNGVLLYLLLADRDVEIVADRGICAVVPQEEWEHVCRDMEKCFAQGQFKAGVLEGVLQITKKLKRHFPKDANDINELPNKPSIR